jgi:hypothetical protein
VLKAHALIPSGIARLAQSSIDEGEVEYAEAVRDVRGVSS